MVLETRDQLSELDSIVMPFLDGSFTKILNTPILSFNSRSYTRRELVSIGVGNFVAAQRLQECCRKLGVKTIPQLYTIGPRDFFRIKGVGNAIMWVAMHVLADHGYDVQKWWGWSPDSSLPKFSSYRDRVRRETKRKRIRRTGGGGEHVV